MANTIKNFLVGVGLDTKEFEKGEKEVSGGLGRFRTLAGFAGAAMVGAFGAAGGAAVATAKRVDELALAAEKLNTSFSFVQDYGDSLSRDGGNALEALQVLTEAERLLANFNLKGTFGLDDAVFSGVDTFALTQAQDGEEFLRILADEAQSMSKQQLMILQDALNLSDAVMRSFKGGSEGLDRGVDAVRELTGGSEDLVEISREFRMEVNDTRLAVKGLTNELSKEMLPALTGVFGSVNDFIRENKSGITKTVGFAFSPFGVNLPSAIGSTIDMGASAYDWASGKIQGDDAVSPEVESDSNWFTGMAPVQSTKDWFGDKRQDAIERRIEYRESVDSQEAIQATPEYSIINNNSSERMTLPPQQINTNLEAKLMIDGREIDTRVVDVIERRERATVEDMQSTTVR